MKTITRYLTLSAVVFAVLVAASPVQGQQSYDGRFDIAELMATARERFDCSKQDAVILAEGQQVFWLPDGRLSTLVHRIVWINSRVAINAYSDSRIPYDKERCTFTPLALRTWRDNQWWPTDSSGVVETLPFELEKAYDYSNMREMMLLHNGIENPCIAEIAYRIEDKSPFRKGADGIWLFSRQDPAVESWFELGVPAGQSPLTAAENGAPAAEKTTDQKTGLDVYRWKMNVVEAEPRPHTVDPAGDVPHVTWSTWANWREFGSFLETNFDSSAKTDAPLQAALDSLTRKARTATELAGLIAGFINDHTTAIHYPESYWRTAPRPAEQTLASAYGHHLDRAILAAALFYGAGFDARPVFIAQGVGSLTDNVPSLARFGGVKLRVNGNGLDAYYDPADGTLSSGQSLIFNHTVWNPGDDRPTATISGTYDRGEIETRIDLSFDTEMNKFTGTGFLSTADGLSAFDRMSGVDDKAKTYLNSLVSGLLKGATVTEYNPDRFDQSAAVTTFTMELPKPEPDDQGCVVLVLGKPIGGIVDHLPSDIQAYILQRRSSVRLPFLMDQKIEFRLNLAPWKTVFYPVNQTIENAAGQFTVSSEVKDSQLVVIRELKLTKAVFKPEEWPLLRQLLLAENHEKNRTILLKAVTEEGKADK